MATICLERDAFHGDWNYTIRPRLPQQAPSEVVIS
jgi:hypothetical protein